MSKKNKSIVTDQVPLNGVVSTEVQGDPVTVANEAVVPLPIAAKVPTLTVNMNKAYEDCLRNSKKVLPVDAKFITKNGKEIAFHTALQTALSAIVPENTELPAVVSRKLLLNTFCIQNEMTPSDSKRSNKSENKSAATYGEVPQYEDGFDVDGVNYKLLGFLKSPIVRFEGSKIIMFKYGVYLVLMDQTVFDEQFMHGAFREDVVINVIE